MEGLLPIDFSGLLKQQTADELRQCNAFTGVYGLQLSEKQIQSLIEKRFEALRSTGRVEFGQGILKKLIAEFCDSPFITQENYEELICDLQDSFYYFKNESMDLFSDDELIAHMKYFFDYICSGDMDYLNGTSLEALCRGKRNELESDVCEQNESEVFIEEL